MSSGFNTDVRVGQLVFHVQTEDRGPSRPLIDTVVYQNGRVLHRLTAPYDQYAASATFSDEGLRQRVAEQHRAVIEDLRSGALDAEVIANAEQANRTTGIQVQLLNPSSWLSGGYVSLDVEILSRVNREPEAGAQVEAVIDGALGDRHYSGTSDAQGRVRIQFPLPPLGRGDLALVIQAKADAGKDEIRFAMRTRAKVPPADSAP
jgi:hypothetical protein